MKICEIIKVLNKYPGDMDVYIDCLPSWCHVEDVWDTGKVTILELVAKELHNDLESSK